jgi:predicted Fe-Mo cluster-binding NifX family protein
VKIKIAIASDDKKSISHHFGRALGFVIYTLENNNLLNEEYRENIGKNKGNCGTCDHQAMIENVKDCKYVISHGMGQKIYNDLLKSNIHAIVTEEKTVDDALKKFMDAGLINRIDKLH